MEHISKRIESALLKKNGGNQSELARYVGVTPQAVQKWIAGEAEPKGTNLKLAAEYLGMNEADLRYGSTKGRKEAPFNVVAQVAEPHQVDQPTPDEIIELIALFSQSNSRGRSNILSLARSVAKSGAMRWTRLADDQL